MKFLRFTYKREAIFLVVLHFGLLAVGVLSAAVMYFVGTPN